MALETFPYDSAEYLTSAESIYFYLETELEENEMPYLARVLTTVARARGGMDVVAAETGLTVDLLDRAAQEVGAGDRDTVVKVMEAYRKRMASDSQVA
jgi:probable addiction module antidote protein